MRLWGLLSATTWRTHAAPSGAAWNVGGDIPAYRTHPVGLRPKSQEPTAFNTFPALQTHWSRTIRIQRLASESSHEPIFSLFAEQSYGALNFASTDIQRFRDVDVAHTIAFHT